LCGVCVLGVFSGGVRRVVLEGVCLWGGGGGGGGGGMLKLWYKIIHAKELFWK